ncbi:hypothetical protein HPB51_022399 [Rhipicephalus microplus]|uniref:Uncharacterized protein n=1 Tax=Rhipicephalus microplus TaxID=6941 RepID=A0A9J6DR22_RHIMP|nr:hypothetical protein HPB51_022399 [Rhipicephalus microplus]
MRVLWYPTKRSVNTSQAENRCDVHCSKLCCNRTSTARLSITDVVTLLPFGNCYRITKVSHSVASVRRKSQKLSTRAENARGGSRNQNKLPEISTPPIRSGKAELGPLAEHSKLSRSAEFIQLRKTRNFNKDGILTWDDFNIIAEYYTKLQRHGKLEKEVYERWKSILERWWNELTEHADFNKDYKKYLKTHNLDIGRADECFKEMLNEEDAENGNAMTSDRFTATVYECWVSQDNNCKGKYICGPYDSIPMEELEKKNKKRPV